MCSRNKEICFIYHQSLSNLSNIITNIQLSLSSKHLIHFVRQSYSIFYFKVDPYKYLLPPHPEYNLLDMTRTIPKRAVNNTKPAVKKPLKKVEKSVAKTSKVPKTKKIVKKTPAKTPAKKPVKKPTKVVNQKTSKNIGLAAKVKKLIPAKPAKPAVPKKVKKSSASVIGYTPAQYEKYKEEIKNLSAWSNQKLKDTLRSNLQSMSGNKDELIQKVADGIVLGRIPRCHSCYGGRPAFDFKKGTYTCKGYRDDTDFVNCHKTFTLSQIKRDPWTSS